VDDVDRLQARVLDTLEETFAVAEEDGNDGENEQRP